MRVLVTGAGGAAAVCIIKDLRQRHEVITVDADELASGLYLAHKSFLVPPVNGGDKFIEKILEISKREKVSVVIPTVSEELIHFAKSVPKFLANGMTVIVSNPKSIEVANNKLSTYNFFAGETYCPKVYEGNVEYPCVVKPVSSRGSRGFHVCESERDLQFALEKNSKHFDKSIVMEYLKGPEFSVYGVSDLKGKVVFAIANERIQAVSESKKARMNNDADVLKVARDIATKLNLVGPWNIQIIKTVSGPKLVEVNPRFAGTLSLAIGAGANLVELAIKMYLGDDVKWEEVRYRDRLIMTRYNDEVFIEPEGIVRW